MLARSFRVFVIHQTLTWTTPLTYIRSHSYACVCLHTEVGHTNKRVSKPFLTWITYKLFLALLTGFKLRLCNVKSDHPAIPFPVIYSHLSDCHLSYLLFSESSKVTSTVATSHYINMPLQQQTQISPSLSFSVYVYVKTCLFICR